MKTPSTFTARNNGARTPSDGLMAILKFTASELDKIDFDSLVLSVIDVIEVLDQIESRNELRLVTDFFRRFDKALLVKTYKLLFFRSGIATASSHISSFDFLCADRTKSKLEVIDPALAIRWIGFRDILITYCDATSHRASLFKDNSNGIPVHWSWVLDLLTEASDEGLEWSEIWKLAVASDDPAVSPLRIKSALSLTISTMHFAGWIRIESIGRRRKLFIQKPPIDTKVDSKTDDSDAILGDRLGYSVVFKEVVRAATCFNQGAFIDYFLSSSLKHKKLRKNFDTYFVDGVAIKDSSVAVQSIKQPLQDLTAYMHARIKLMAESNFKFIERYFLHSRGSSSNLPRVTLKILEDRSEGAQVFDIARDHTASVPWVKAPVRSNTGFSEVIRTGRYFLANDLVNEVLAGRYENPRIRKDRLMEFSRSFAVSRSGTLNNEQWKSLWIGSESNNEFRSAYKSTLIIPLTLVNTPVSDQFRKLVALQTRKAQDLPIDRLIMGFLCFDHPDKNFFNESMDIDIGYMFADWMTMFIFVRHMYTNMSTTFEQLLSLAKPVGDDESVSNEIINLSIAEIRRGREAGHFSFGGLPVSSKNNLVVGSGWMDAELAAGTP